MRSNLSVADEFHNLKRIKCMILNHLWCPPPRSMIGIKKCSLCNCDIDLDKSEPNFYAVWIGLICGRCSNLFKDEIEELAML